MQLAQKITPYMIVMLNVKEMNKPFQRKDAKSNTHVGKEFERATKDFFASQGMHL